MILSLRDGHYPDPAIAGDGHTARSTVLESLAV